MQIYNGNTLVETVLNRIDYSIEVCENTDNFYQKDIDDNSSGPRIPLCELSAINSTLKLAKDIINAQNRIVTERFGGL